MRRPVLFLSLALMASCAVGPSRQQLLAPLIGVSEADLVSRMGVPNRTYETGGIKFLAYDQQRVDVFPAYPWWGPWWGGNYGGWPQVIVRGCETTFEIEGGRVRSFTLRGNDC